MRTGRSLRAGSLRISGFSSTKSLRSTSSRGAYRIDVGLGFGSAGCSRDVCLEDGLASISGAGGSTRSASTRGACLKEVGLGRGCATAGCSRDDCRDADVLVSATASGFVFRLFVLLIAAGGAINVWTGSTFSCRCCRGGGGPIDRGTVLFERSPGLISVSCRPSPDESRSSEISLNWFNLLSKMFTRSGNGR